MKLLSIVLIKLILTHPSIFRLLSKKKIIPYADNQKGENSMADPTLPSPSSAMDRMN